MSERNDRKVTKSVLLADKMDKTITVVVETYKKHTLYHKRIKYYEEIQSS